MKIKKLICAISIVTMLFSMTAFAAPNGTQVHANTVSIYENQSILNLLKEYFSKYFSTTEDSSDTNNSNTEKTLDKPNISVTGSFNQSKQIREINIDWETVDKAEKYVVQLSLYEDFADIYKEKETTNGYYNYIISSGGTAPYYFPANATYYIRVKAIAGEVGSEWSNVVVSSVNEKFPTF